MAQHLLKNRWALAAMLVMIGVAPALLAFNTPTSSAQEGSRAFPETGKTVRGKFLQYWDSHGGLAQQGYPISEEVQEVSETDGKTYTVQYFERAVFELHPENQPPNDVLLSLLGVFLYKQKYQTGAPSQTANNDPSSVAVPETGKRLGGIFLDYWRSHGGLAQQGYPISDEFNEVSDLNGKTYKVQYFERAVFEDHPENQPPYNVLLSQLGNFRYKAKYVRAPGPVPPPTAVAQPEPTVGTLSCPETPPDVNVRVYPKCRRGPGSVNFAVSGFAPGEFVDACFLAPGNPDTCYEHGTWRADRDGKMINYWLRHEANDPRGLWTLRLIGKQSGVNAMGYWTFLP